MKRSRTLVSAILASMMVAPVATALPGGQWGSGTSPLHYGTISEAWGVWQGYREDQNRGSRIQDWSAHRSPSGPSADRGAYVKTDWWFNTNRCYLTSFSEAGGSIACSQGWWKTGQSTTGRTESQSWQYYDSWSPIDMGGESGKGAMFACYDRAWAPDSCSSFIARGTSY